MISAHVGHLTSETIRFGDRLVLFAKFLPIAVSRKKTSSLVLPIMEPWLAVKIGNPIQHYLYLSDYANTTTNISQV